MGKECVFLFIPAGNALVDDVTPIFLFIACDPLRDYRVPGSVGGGMGEHFKGSPDPITLICTGKRSR